MLVDLAQQVRLKITEEAKIDQLITQQAGLKIVEEAKIAQLDAQLSSKNEEIKVLTSRLERLSGIFNSRVDVKMWTCKGFKTHRPRNRCGNSIIIVGEFDCDSLCRDCKDSKYEFEKRLRYFEDFDASLQSIADHTDSYL